MKRNTLLSVLASVLFLTAGCVKVSESVRGAVTTVVTGHPGGAYETVNATKYDLENQQLFVLLDSGTERSVTCSRLELRPMPDGRMEVLANVRNRQERRIQVEINCVFKDDRGFSTGDETPFQTLILTENAQETVRFVSANTLAKKYTIRVRQAR
ncbi:MAG: YcfL family protein [Opitutaceae bacterium]|nr:YcfL family protein [Verrucomicrobiales bacterium]